MYAIEAKSAPQHAGGLWRAAIIAAVLATAINSVIRVLTVTLFEIDPAFRPFTWPQFILFTVAGVAGAVVVYSLVARRAAQPATTFRRIAIGALLVSFVPDVALLTSQIIPGMTVPAFVALSLMHVTTAVISVHLLVGCARGRQMP